jgi:KDO2-lipid IV(A) lauroyltransferase
MLRMLEPLPYPLLMTLGRALGRFVRRLPVKFVRIARVNIHLCFPELSESEREIILNRHFESLGIALMETSMAWWSSDARIDSLSRIEGMEHLEHAYTKGRGAILWAAHFTTLEIGARALSARIPLNILYRPTSNRVMAYFLARNRAKHTKRAIQRDDIRTVIGALKANEPVWYASDQSYKKKGAEMVPFFGVPCATNTATTRIARMSKTTVLPYFQERLPNNEGYRIVIGAPFEPFPTDDPIADALRYHHAIEAQIRHVPEQYLWIHRRFKGLSEEYPDYYRRDTRHETRDAK